MVERLPLLSQAYDWLDQHRSFLLRVVAPVGVLAVAFALGTAPNAIYLVGFAGIAGLVALLRYPMLGYVALIVGSLAVPFALGTGSESTLNPGLLVAVMLLGLWVMRMIHRRRFVLVRSRTMAPLLAFVLIAVLAFINGQMPWFMLPPAPIRAQIGALFVFVLSAGVFLVVANEVREQKWLERLTWLFLIVGGLLVLIEFLPPLRQLQLPIPQSVYAGSLFWMWLVTMAFSQAMFNRKLRPLWRGVLFGLLFITLFMSVIQRRDWLSGWMPSLVSMVVILLLGSPRLGVLASLAGAVIVVARFANISETLMGSDNSYSLMTRLAAWSILGEVIKINPVLGLGPANYYWYTPAFNILGYSLNFNSHNNYVDIAAQLGLLGLACFLWLAWRIGRLGWDLRLQAPEGFPRAYVYGMMGGLAGTMVAAFLGDWVLPFVYNVGLAGFRVSVMGWLFLGGLVALEQMLKNAQPAATDNRSGI